MSLNPLNWLEWIVSWILVQFHTVFGAMFGAASGWAWVLSIVGLVVVIRIALIPLFVRQIKSQRNLQILQPKIKEIQKKYAGDREKQSAGDDGALQGDGDQPAGELPADPGAGADLLRPVPGAAGHRAASRPRAC